MNLHEFLDTGYGDDGDDVLRRALADGVAVEAVAGEAAETPLHVAARRRRASACVILLEHGVDVDARNGHRKTAHVHAMRRGFDDVVEVLLAHGADPTLNEADQLAVALTRGCLDEARAILRRHPEVARTGNPDEDRLLADLAGRNETEPVALLIEAGADLAAPGLDGGSPLHQAAWFGQPANAALLIEAGAPLDPVDAVHGMTPIGWVAHGSRFSGGADERAEPYVEVARLLLDAGCSLRHPGLRTSGPTSIT